MDSHKSVSGGDTIPENTTNRINDDLGHDANAPTPTPFPLSPPNAPNPNEVTQSVEVILSPLDQRCYKSITLPNGVKVMLISTREVEYFASEQDATAPLCQVPEVAEFNKKYLGYDNPAARVKCACPCGKTKTCCGQSENSQRDNVENIVEEEPSHTIPEQPGNPPAGNLLTADPITDGEEHDRNIMHMTGHGKKGLALSETPQQCCQRCECCQPRNKCEDANLTSTAVNGSSEELETNSLANRKSRRPSRHYPFPPKFVEGLQTIRTCPTGGSGSSRPKTNRPHFNSDFNLDLEGTVYLVIGSGYFDDPDDQPGLAHFCEHAVFLGSEVFPEPNQLFKLVLPYDGYVNAYTSGMSTTFTTSASYRLFPLAVEILADMVGFPLFPNDLVAAELEALDSEYSLRQDDTPKYFQLIGSLAKKGHVIRKMDSGNISTIRIPNYYRKLIEWRRMFYSPNRMTLAFEAPFPLDFLEKLAMETFGRIPAAHATIPSRIFDPSCPFDMKKFHQIYHVPSVHHSEFIALHWTLEPKAWKNLKVKPLEYLGAIIAHKAEGGLVHYLTSKGLATNVDAGCWESDVTRNHFTSIFSISVDLTEKGFKKQDNILQAIFGYIEMLIREGPKKTFFHELQKQQLESFHYKAAESSQSLAESISRWMQFIPPKWCLISPILTCEFDEGLIRKCTECLTVESVNVIVFSKNYGGAEETGGRGMEEFYNTPFSSYDFPAELKETLSQTKDEYSRKFIFPPPNPFLLNTACRRSPEQDLLKKGCFFRVKGKLTVSYMSRKVQLVKGLLPQARYSIWIGSPITSYLGAPEGSSTRLHILSHYLNALFQIKFYHASNADLELGTEVSQGELHLLFAGAHVILPCLFEQVLKLLNDFENVVDQTGFDVVKSAFIENLDNTILDNRFLAWDLYYYLWTNNHELIFDHRRHAEELTFSGFLSFVKEFKKKMYIQAHLYGYITNVQGDLIVKSLENLLYDPVDLREYLLLRCMRQKLGERIIKVNSQNPSIHTSVVINSYQFGMLTEAEEEALNFFAKTMSDAAFYQLRTEQQLGYIIIIYAEITFGVSSIVVELVTQPKNFTTEHCNECIDNFLLDFYMENLASPESYHEFCRGKPKLDLSFEALTELFQTYLLPNPFHYRKLSVQVVGTIEDGPGHPTGTTEDIHRTTHSGSGGYDNSDFNEEFLEEGIVLIHQTTSIRAKSTILQVRSVKKSLQVRDDGFKKNTGMRDTGKKIKSGHKPNVCTRVVKDLGKFKKSLTYFPTLE